MRTDFGDPGDILRVYLPGLAPAASLLTQVRVAATAAVHGSSIVQGYSRANCEVAARTSAIALPARLLAAADVFQAMIQERAHRPARSPDEAADVLAAEARAGRLDADATRAVVEAAGRQTGRMPRAQTAGLTERQVDVLRLLARGLTNRQIAERLVITGRTAEHHVQDIYARIGVSSRAAAALYGMEHDLLV
jgi:DNA-binding CsgD family transcriptional regulator